MSQRNTRDQVYKPRHVNASEDEALNPPWPLPIGFILLIKLLDANVVLRDLRHSELKAEWARIVD